jgi:LacI family transcriptional regulator
LTKRVLEVVKELDYTINHMARSLQTRSSHSIGMLIPGEGGPDPFFSEVVRGVEDVLRKKGYALILGHTYNRVEEQSRYLQAFRARLIDGYLLFQAPGVDEDLDRILQKGQPIVFVGRIPRSVRADVVATDIRKGTEMAVTHLIGRGHQRIGLSVVTASMSVASFRAAAWRRALTRHGLSAGAEYISEGEFSLEAGRAAVRRFLAHEAPPTAIFADNLVHTTGMLAELQERGISCPNQVEIMSSDDAEWLNVLQPPISTVIQPSYVLGVQSAELLLKRIKHPRRKFERILLPPQLKIRT